MSPGADGHLVRVVYVGTAAAAVTPAEAVVVHAVLLLLLLLTSASDDGNAPLDRTALSRNGDKAQSAAMTGVTAVSDSSVLDGLGLVYTHGQSLNVHRDLPG